MSIRFRSSAFVAALVLAVPSHATAAGVSLVYSYRDAPYPQGTLALDPAGRLFAIIQYINYGCSTFVRYTPPADPKKRWSESRLYSLDRNTVGCISYAGVTRDAEGNLFTETNIYSASPVYGVVVEAFKPTPPDKNWTARPIADFSKGAFDQSLYGPLVIGPDRTLNGAVFAGGKFGYGAVFQLVRPTASGGTWRKVTLHDFTGGAGAAGPAALVFRNTGVLYGTTDSGGGHGAGTVFSLTPPIAPAKAWTYKILHSFDGAEGGAGGGSGLIADRFGTLYGTTYKGGATACNDGCGVVFSLTPPAHVGGAWTYRVLHRFSGGLGGYYPTRGVIRDQAGNLYGVTTHGGIADNGLVYRLSPPAKVGGKWVKTVLFRFRGDGWGGRPTTNLIFDKTGAIIGGTAPTVYGKPSTIFRIVP